MAVDDDGNQLVPIDGNVSIEVGDIEIGAVEIKDGTTDRRATVDTSNRLVVAQTPSTAVTVTTSAVVLGVAGVYRGFSLRETSGTATATVRIYNNASAASGVIVETIQLNPSESRSESLPVGVTVVGIYFEKVSGTVEGSVRHG